MKNIWSLKIKIPLLKAPVRYVYIICRNPSIKCKIEAYLSQKTFVNKIHKIPLFNSPIAFLTNVTQLEKPHESMFLAFIIFHIFYIIHHSESVFKKVPKWLQIVSKTVVHLKKTAEKNYPMTPFWSPAVGHWPIRAHQKYSTNYLLSKSRKKKFTLWPHFGTPQWVPPGAPHNYCKIHNYSIPVNCNNS